MVLTEVTAVLFSELYSAYYNAVARIIESAFSPGVTDKDLRRCVLHEAFSDSVLTILPALKSGKWHLLNPDLTPILRHKPTMPLTTLELRWLKAISEDPRIKLFDVSFPSLEGIEPLFTRDDYKIYDQYSDGDPYDDENYIEHFRLILTAIKTNRPVSIKMTNRRGKRMRFRFYPVGYEYSAKDDKLRVIASGCRYNRFNLGRIEECEYYDGKLVFSEKPEPDKKKELVLLIIDERNALERAMLHFAHFEKRTERIDNEKYTLHLKYYENDETEIVIRVLSFGPYVKVLEPRSFVDLIKERLLTQKSCGL